MKLPYEIADMCKRCIKEHIKQKGKFEVKCTPVPKNMEVEEDAIYPLDKVLGEQTYSKLPEDVKISMQLSKNKLLWAKECLGWSPYNKVREFYQFYQREYLLCTAKNKVMRFGRRLGKCIEENSFVTTYNRGPIRAKYLNHNDELLTFDEKTKKITHTKLWTKTDNGVKECIEIITETGKKDTVTTNHPYYVYRKNNFEWVEAKDLKVGDLVYIAKNYSGTFDEYENQRNEPDKFKMFGNFISMTNKKIPPKIFKCSLTNIAFFINGLFEYDTEKTKDKIIYSTTSHELAIGLKHLLVRFGIHAYLLKTHEDYKLKINLKENAKDCEKIISVNNVGEHKTYSISVVDTHTFITNDIVTHNTEGMVIDILHFAFTNPGVKIVVVAPFLNLTTEIFNRIEMLLSGKDSIFKNDYTRKKQPSEKIKLSNGSEINGFTTATDGKAIRGQSANKVYIDEGAYIPEEAYQVLMAFKLDNKDVAFNVASTPSALETKFKHWCMVDTHWKATHYPSSILPDFHEHDEAELRNSLTADGYLLEVEAEFIEGSTRVFKSHNINNCKSDYNYINSRSELPDPHNWYITIGELSTPFIFEE